MQTIETNYEKLLYNSYKKVEEYNSKIIELNKDNKILIKENNDLKINIKQIINTDNKDNMSLRIKNNSVNKENKDLKDELDTCNISKKELELKYNRKKGKLNEALNKIKNIELEFNNKLNLKENKIIEIENYYATIITELKNKFQKDTINTEPDKTVKIKYNNKRNSANDCTVLSYKSNSDDDNIFNLNNIISTSNIGYNNDNKIKEIEKKYIDKIERYCDIINGLTEEVNILQSKLLNK